MNLPQPRGLPGSHEPVCRISPRSPCSVCPPSHGDLPTSLSVASSLFPGRNNSTT
ncbi:hypothetical protein XENOCAPTIV_007724, partial [Xenoophorus captivus]